MSRELRPDSGDVSTCQHCNARIVWLYDDGDTEHGWWFETEWVSECCPKTDDSYHRPQGAVEDNGWPLDPKEVVSNGHERGCAWTVLTGEAAGRPREGITICGCGSKYWDGDRCHSCGSLPKGDSSGDVCDGGANSG